MALVKCKECGHEVSDKASVCPQCGCTINRKNGAAYLIAVVAFCILAAGGYFVFTNLSNGDKTKDAVETIASETDGTEETASENVAENKAVETQQYDKFGELSQGLMAAHNKNGEWSYLDKDKKEVIAGMKAISANKFSDGLAVVFNDNEHFSVINTKGQVIFKGKCDYSQWGEASDMYMDEAAYMGGRVCISSPSGMFIVYDKQGNQVGELSESAYGRLMENGSFSGFLFEDESEGYLMDGI